MEWKFNGKRVPLGQLGNVVAKAFEEGILGQSKAAIAAIKCPAHGGGATNINVTRSGDRLQFKYEACCDELKRTISKEVSK